MIYIFLAFLTGVIIVLNMMINGKLAQREGMINGLIINYLMATIASVLLCIVMMETIPSFSTIKSVPLPYFLGGFLGVITTYIFNRVVSKISAVYIVILRFIGQLLASTIIDYIYLDVFTKGKVIGGILFFIGLIFNARVDKKYEQENLKPSMNV